MSYDHTRCMLDRARCLVSSVLVAAVCLTVLWLPKPAHAVSSAELSDDGVDYGWLYRRGNGWYSIDPNTSAIQERVVVSGGHYYCTDSSTTNYGSSNQHYIRAHLYQDGTLFFHDSTHESLEAIVRSGSTEKAEASGLSFRAPVSSTRLSNFILWQSYTRKTNRDVRRVLFESGIGAYWANSSYGLPQDLSHLFEGCDHLIEIGRFSELRTDKVHSMERMFYGCRELEEIDLSSFDTSMCDNFQDMFYGCDSLTTLRLGDGWTQKQILSLHEVDEITLAIESLRAVIGDEWGWTPDDRTLYLLVGEWMGLTEEEVEADEQFYDKFCACVLEWYREQLAEMAVEEDGDDAASDGSVTTDGGPGEDGQAGEAGVASDYSDGSDPVVSDVQGASSIDVGQNNGEDSASADGDGSSTSGDDLGEGAQRDGAGQATTGGGGVGSSEQGATSDSGTQPESTGGASADDEDEEPDAASGKGAGGGGASVGAGASAEGDTVVADDAIADEGVAGNGSQSGGRSAGEGTSTTSEAATGNNGQGGSGPVGEDTSTIGEAATGNNGQGGDGSVGEDTSTIGEAAIGDAENRQGASDGHDMTADEGTQSSASVGQQAESSDIETRDDVSASDGSDAQDHPARAGMITYLDYSKYRFARFSRPMVRQEDGVFFEAGEIIPDGAGTYVATEGTYIRHAMVAVTDYCEHSYDAGTRYLCDYTGYPVRLGLRLEWDGVPLTEGVDYTVKYENNVKPGKGEAIVCGKGAYYGTFTVPFTIVNTAAYAFLYDNGLLVLKQGKGTPDSKLVSATRKTLFVERWFCPDTDAFGGMVPSGTVFGRAVPDSTAPVMTVPWASMADKVKRVVIEESFSNCRLFTCAGWFAGCTSLTSVEGLEHINTRGVTSMAGMFEGCTALTKLSLSGIDTKDVSDLSRFAYGCKALTKLDLGDIDLSNATTTNGFVDDCPKLAELVCGSGFVNAEQDSVRLTFDSTALRTKLADRASYQRFAKGSTIPNGDAAASATYRLRNLSLERARITINKGAFTCTGKAIKPPIEVQMDGFVLQKDVDYTINYSHNVYPGKAKATIKGRGVFSGVVVVPYTIKARVTKVGDRLVYTNSQATYTFKVTSVTKGGTAADVELVGVKVLKGSLTSLALPSQCTVNGVTVSLTTISSKLTGTYRNVSTIIIGAKVTKIGSRAFANKPKVKKLIIKSARLTSVTNCLAGSKVTAVAVKVSLTKAKRVNYKLWFTKKAGKSGVRVTFG